jgi:hypothetical protein
MICLFQATADVVATRCECPFIFCESSLNDWAHSRYWKRLRFTLMEFYEHSETCTDRREHALEVIIYDTLMWNAVKCLTTLFFHCFKCSVPRVGTVNIEAPNDGRNVPRANSRRTTL